MFRNALLPVITMLGMDIGVAFAGALFIETVFALPGMGQLLVLSLANGDVPVILGIVLTVSFAVVVANLFVDILYSVLDPRIRLSGSSDAAGLARGRASAAGAAAGRAGFAYVSHSAHACS